MGPMTTPESVTTPTTNTETAALASTITAVSQVSILSTNYQTRKNEITTDLQNFQDFDPLWQQNLVKKFQEYTTAALTLYKTDLAPGKTEPSHLATIEPAFQKIFPAIEVPAKDQLKNLPTAFQSFQEAVEQEMRPGFFKSMVRSATQTLSTAAETLTGGYLSLSEGTSWLNTFSRDFVTLGTLLKSALQKEELHLNTLKQESERTKAQLVEQEKNLRAIEEQLQRAEPSTSSELNAEPSTPSSELPTAPPPSASELAEEVRKLREREIKWMAALKKDQELLATAEQKRQADQVQKERLLSLLNKPSKTSDNYWAPLRQAPAWTPSMPAAAASSTTSASSVEEDQILAATTHGASRRERKKRA